MVIAILFYAGLGAFIAWVIWDNKQEKAKPKNQVATPQYTTVNRPLDKSGQQFIAIGVVAGLLFVFAMVWLGKQLKEERNTGRAVPPSVSPSYPPSTPVSQPTLAPVWVNGYFRSDGTYIPGHWRSAPDGDQTNNWSNQPNLNPYTGQRGTQHPKAGR